ncbi:MAG: glycosyltransferase [Caldilineaceae bacterium]|nr:glycosyltransferase [Caldilineaceae bacterium]
MAPFTKPMRILHLYHDFWPARGGIEDYLTDLLPRQTGQPLVGQGTRLEPVLLCASPTTATTEGWFEGVRVVRAGALGRYYTPIAPTWPAWIRRLRPDLIHLHLPCPLGEWAIALADPRTLLVVSLHNEYVRPAWALALQGRLQRRLLQRAAAILVGAPDYAATSPVLAGLGHKVHTAPYGIDLPRYARRDAPPAPGAGVLFAGRLTYYKGVEVLLDAARLIKAPITIAGDGPWRARLQGQARRLGLDARVTFLGAVDDARLIDLMQHSQVFVFPSTERSESFGLVQLKAMACGLPVVSTTLPGVSWLNQDGQTGLTVPPCDAPELAAAVNRLLADEHLRARLAAGAAARARHFDLATMTAAVTQVYAAVMADAQHPHL